MKKRGRVILNFKDCKLRKKLMEKKNELKQLHFKESLENLLKIIMPSFKKCQKNQCLLVFQQPCKCAIDE